MGGVFKEDGKPIPVICGGEDSSMTSCTKWDDDKWTDMTHSIGRYELFGATSVMLDDHILWLIGGARSSNSQNEKPTSTKLLYYYNGSGKMLDGPRLGAGLEGACSTVIGSGQDGEKAVAILGGSIKQNTKINSMDVYTCQLHDHSGEPSANCTFQQAGPALNTPRTYFGCAAIQTEQGGWVLLAMSTLEAPSVEILDLSVGNSGWRECK